MAPLTQDDCTVYISKLSPKESANLITVNPDHHGLVSLPHQMLSPQFVKTIVQPSRSDFLRYTSIDFLASSAMVRPLVIQPYDAQSDLTIVLTWMTPVKAAIENGHSDQSNSQNSLEMGTPIELDLYVDFMVQDKFKCSVSSYLPVC